MNLALSPSSVLDRELFCPELRQRLIAHAFLERHLDIVDDGPVRNVDGRASLRDGHARLEAREDVDPVVAPVGERLRRAARQLSHRDWREHPGLVSECRPVEAWRRHADNRHRLAVDDDGVTDDRRAGVETRAPVVVAEHHHGGLAGGLVVGRSDQPAQGRLQAEHLEVAAGHEHAVGVERLPAIRQVRAERPVRGHAREHGLRLLEIAEHRITEDRLRAAGVVARLGSRLRAGRRQVDQPPRVLHRQGPEQHLVEQREDRGIRANAKPQRDDGHDGDEWRSEQRPERELDALHEVVRLNTGTRRFSTRNLPVRRVWRDSGSQPA